MFAMAKAMPTGNLFKSEVPLKVTLKYDIKKLQATKASQRENGLPGTLQIDGKSLHVGVLTRGKGSFSCKQTQLKIDFRKTATAGTSFEGFKKIKLFTTGSCLDNKTDAENDKRILANYLIYKLYEQVFPIHFKTRLVEISYVDAGGKIKPYTQLAFFMEPDQSLEPRLNLQRIEAPELHELGTKLPEMADPETVSLLHAFNFFIGNYDYGIPGFYSHIAQSVFNGEKNVQMFQGTSKALYPIGFDWDFSRFNYYGDACNVSIRFFIDGGMSADCSAKELMFVYEDDFVAFRYQGDVLRNLPRLTQAFEKWRAANKANLEKLGTKYNEGLDAFTEAFEPAIRY
jgi:hypothetical protein